MADKFGIVRELKKRAALERGRKERRKKKRATSGGEKKERKKGVKAEAKWREQIGGRRKSVNRGDHSCGSKRKKGLR